MSSNAFQGQSYKPAGIDAGLTGQSFYKKAPADVVKQLEVPESEVSLNDYKKLRPTRDIQKPPTKTDDIAQQKERNQQEFNNQVLSNYKAARDLTSNSTVQ